jgi:fucose permease
MLSKAETTNDKFERDQIAWFSYLMIATYCYCSAALGPLMSFLRAELHLDYTLAAYHFGIWALGVCSAGFFGDKCMKKFGKRRTVWTACVGLCLGIIVLITATSPIATISGAFICGINGSVVSQTSCTIIAERFANLRAIAITEANIAASLFCCIAPLAIARLSQTPLGWRAAMIFPIVLFFVYYLWADKRLKSLPEQKSEFKGEAKNQDAGALPRTYWLCWTLIFLNVASEWSIIYWSADFLERTANLAKADAAACVTSFLFAMVTGRALGSRLVRELKAQSLLRIASIVALSGFLIFWLNKLALICVVGLFIAGLGISNFYPLTLSLAIANSNGQTSKATSRMALSSGGSTLVAPLVLGLFAQHTGIFAAYGLIAVLLSLCSVMIFLPIWAPESKPQV